MSVTTEDTVDTENAKQNTFYKYLTFIQLDNNYEETMEYLFLKRYPFTLDILPNEILTNKQIKSLLQSFIEYFDYTLFKHVWLNYFKWKLNQCHNKIILDDLCVGR